MITPPNIRTGDRIAIVSPARKIKREEVHTAIEVFQSWGLEVLEGRNLYDDFHQFAGDDDARRSSLQEMMDDETVKAIICSRGGYGTVRIVDDLDFTRFVEKPKWIIGYSDITVLHSHIHMHYGIETLHAIMPVNFKSPCDRNPSVTTLKKSLMGKELDYTFPSDPGSRQGNAKGQLVGGNLSILYSLSGTPSDINTDGKILFIEDLDEYLYHIDRMMMNLKRSGKLEKLAGLVVGGMTGMNDNTVPYDKTANEIIMEAVKDYDYPVCLNFPAGHLDENYALILGRHVELEVGSETRLGF